jgi:ATP-binding cassette subfamily B protein
LKKLVAGGRLQVEKIGCKLRVAELMGEKVNADKYQTMRERIGYLRGAVGFVWASSRKWTIAWLLLLAIQGVLPIATVYLTKPTVNAVTSRAWSSLLFYGALIAGVLLLSELLSGAASWIRGIQAELLKDHISSVIHAKSVEADLAFYESAEFYDRLHRARDEASSRPLALLESTGSAIQNGITLAAMAAVLIPFGIWIPAALCLSTIPALYVVVRFTLKQHKLWENHTPGERRSWYYDWILTSGETAAEVRLFGLGSYFKDLYQALRRSLRGDRLRLAKNQSLAELGAGAASLVITGGSLLWMASRVMAGALTLGDLALFYQAFNKGQGLMRSLLQNVGHIYSNSLFLGNLFEFLSLQPKVVDPVQPVPLPSSLRQGISFEDVGFSYPGTDRFALRNFNLNLPAGRITAIVGANGAGKSTLIKLICRLYDPNEGRVCLDGIDLRKAPIEDLRRAVTVLFQQPVHYNATVAENISLGDIRGKPSRDEIQQAAIAAGAVGPIAGLKQGYDTMLGKWFENGEELSVGEWQRIALARAFLRKSPILLLDEPTSAMDSWAEADWIERLRENTRGRTVLIITHRFTTAMWADNIHVMLGGEIVESGTHGELIQKHGMYAESWDKQVAGFKNWLQVPGYKLQAMS